MIDVPKTGGSANVSKPVETSVDYDELIDNQRGIVKRIQSDIFHGDDSFESLSKLDRHISLLEQLQSLKFAENHTQQALVPGRFMGVGAIGQAARLG